MAVMYITRYDVMLSSPVCGNESSNRATLQVLTEKNRMRTVP